MTTRKHPVMHLSFKRLDAELLETVLSDIASAVMDVPVSLGRFRNSAFRGEQRTRTLSADGVTVTEQGSRVMEPGRDGGWGYTMTWTIEAQAPCGPVRLSFGASGWEPVPNGLALRMDGVDRETFARVRARLHARLSNDADQTGPRAVAEPAPKPKPKPKPKQPRLASSKVEPSTPITDTGPDRQTIDAYLRDHVGAPTAPCTACAALADGWLMVCNAPIGGDAQFGVQHPTLAPCMIVTRSSHPASEDDWSCTSHVQRCSVCGQLYRYDHDYDSDMFYGGTSVGIRKITSAQATEFLLEQVRARSSCCCWDSAGVRLLGPE